MGHFGHSLIWFFQPCCLRAVTRSTVYRDKSKSGNQDECDTVQQLVRSSARVRDSGGRPPAYPPLTSRRVSQAQPTLLRGGSAPNTPTPSKGLRHRVVSDVRVRQLPNPLGLAQSNIGRGDQIANEDSGPPQLQNSAIVVVILARLDRHGL